MGRNYIALAIPVFFFFIGVEWLAARLLGRRVHRLTDAYGDLGCGIVQQVVGASYGAALLGVYAWAHERFAVLDLGQGALVWVAAFLGVDFFYYWWHRASHRVNLLWAGHVVHHQSEDMNLAVALRQAPVTNFTILPFYLPLALAVPPLVLGAAAAFNTLYQFWIHSELIPKLGPLEWVLNTPSHHRAHHGVNPRYIDKNYGGILIVWDRLFGTFEVESEPVVYGTVEPLRSFDPVWAQVHPWVVMARMAWRAPRLLDKARVWLMPPEWAPEGLPAHAPPGPVSPETRPKHEVPLPKALGAWVFFQLAVTVVATFLFLLYHRELDGLAAGATTVLVVATLAGGAALFERRGSERPEPCPDRSPPVYL